MLSVGIDLTSSTRFEFITRPGGDAFYQRVFTAAEQLTCGHTLSLLATCFAAKEAVSKVLGTGLSIGEGEQVSCRSIEISDIVTNEPKAQLVGAALYTAQQLGINQIVLHRDSIGDCIVVYAIGADNISEDNLQKILGIIHKTIPEIGKIK